MLMLSRFTRTRYRSRDEEMLRLGAEGRGGGG
jgi:hypothetical protein